EEHGLVERVRDAEDRRVVLVQSTAKGHDAIQELEAQRREYLRRVLNAMTAEERANCYQVFQVMRRVSERLAANAPEIVPTTPDVSSRTVCPRRQSRRREPQPMEAFPTDLAEKDPAILLSQRRKMEILFAILLGLFLSALDQTIVGT